MPLSTAQALAKWDAVLSLLAEEKARAAAHPGPAAERLSPARLQHLEACLTVATHEVPASTLQKLLQKQVPRMVLAGCSELPTACLETAVSVAEVLVTRADECLHSAPPGSSTNRLSAEMWEQIEQSGFLQQLPRIFDSHIQAMQARMAATGPSLGAAPAELDDGILLNLLAGLNSMRPLHTFAAGVQCLVPAMQLSMLSLRHLSTTLARVGRQPWMAKVLRLVWNGVSVATPAAASLLDPQQAGASSSSSGGSSTSQQAAPGEPGLNQARAQAVQAMLRAEVIMQCLALAGLVWMLVQHIHQAISPPGDQWLPAALARSLPAAYSTMLEQLGCSREAGLWLADVVKHLVAPAAAGPSSGARDSRPWVLDYVLIGLTNYSTLLQACDAHSTLPRKRLALLLLSVPGTTLQWLLGMPPACLRRLGDNFVTACHLASEAGRGAQKIVMQHDWRAGDAKPGGALEVMRAANTATLALGTALLDKLLGMCRPMPGGPNSSSSSSRASLAARQGDRDLLLQCCPFVVETLALALAVLTNEGRALAAGCGASAAAAAASRESHQLPVGCGQLCKLLQEFVRLSAAAAASAPPSAAD